ncbi:MAG: ABC transporter substrate-binding protein, partial [Acidimicrobiia bacterium]|nr:ABC transporter substrate-binding protein [Acidimicrobiia bacterium]
LDVKVALVMLMIAAGVAAVWRRWEAYAAVGVVLLAGVLGQLPNPAAVPLFSQRHPQPVGSTVTTTSTGNTLLAVALSPGRAGLNRLVVSVERPDDNDVPLPVSGVGPIDVSATCACGAPPVSGHLTPVDGSAALAGSVLLPRTGRWSLRLAAPDGQAAADVDVTGTPASDDVVIGVPADLSGPDADACQDQVLGLQVAAAEVNERGVAGGRAVRVVAVDNHGPDPTASVRALHDLGARMLAMPCGPTDAVASIQRSAASADIPVVGGDGSGSSWAWPTLASADVEGTALARQLERQGARSALFVDGNGQREHAVAAAAAAALGHDGLPVRSLSLADPAATAAQIRQENPDAVLFALSATEAPPLLQALAAVDDNWGPDHGAVATSSMMSATVVSTGGDWFKDGRVTVASEVNPADGTALDYATRLQQLAPGRHPSVDGVRGYVAGWLIANVLHRVPDPTPNQVRDQFAHDLRSFVIGPTRLAWNSKGGGAETVAFFQTVFTNPLALAGLPGTVGHSGVFLGQGSFVQVTPWTNTP